MKIGIFGGAFNPIHIGHMITIEEVREKLQLDKILFIPTFQAPHKSNLIDYRYRREMVRLAIKDNPRFELCDIEKDKCGVSWTINTLQTLHKQFIHDDLYLIIGSDQYAVIDTWKQPDSLKNYAKIIVMLRPGSQIRRKARESIKFVKISQIDIASSDLRKDIRNNLNFKYKLSEDVYKYIRKNKLYMEGK